MGTYLYDVWINGELDDNIVVIANSFEEATNQVKLNNPHSDANIKVRTHKGSNGTPTHVMVGYTQLKKVRDAVAEQCYSADWTTDLRCTEPALRGTDPPVCKKHKGWNPPFPWETEECNIWLSLGTEPHDAPTLAKIRRKADRIRRKQQQQSVSEA